MGDYYLIPFLHGDERRSCEDRWQSKVRYHEHRPLQTQTSHTHRISEWLARDVIEPLQPASLLELGCGAGRNLRWLREVLPEAEICGLDIHKDALEVAKREIPSGTFRDCTLYDLADYQDASIDIVFTSGVLMHVPHEDTPGVVREMHRIATTAVVHYELHGPSHGFDYQRYPRDYGRLYARLALGTAVHYEVFPRRDFRSGGLEHYGHALLVSRKQQA